MENLKVISHLFPTKLMPHQGKFVADQVGLLKNILPVGNLSVSVPTPLSIPFTLRAKNNSSKFLAFSEIAERFTYLSFPRMKFPQIIQKSISREFERVIFTQEPCNIAHIHFLYPGGLLLPVFKKKGIPTVLTIHGSDFYKLYIRKDLRPFIENSLRLVDRLLLVGPQLLTDLTNLYPIYSTKYSQIDNFVDESQYTLSDLSIGNKAKEKLNWDNKKIHFLTVASNRPEKGLDILSKAISALGDRADKIVFHIVGNRNDSLAQAPIPNETIMDFIPSMPAQELLTYYHAADAYISPSRREGFGLAMIEAAATGIPIVATPTGIAPDFVDTHTGILCNNFGPETLEKAIRLLISKIHEYTPELIREKVVNRFGKEAFGSKLFNIYQEVLKARQ